MSEREEEIMIPTSNHKEKHHQTKEESFRWLNNTATLFFYFTCITITIVIIISLQLILNDNSIKFPNDIRNFKQKNVLKGTESCDIFRGRWIPEPNASLYTESTCKQLASTNNCFLHGRKDRDFLDWKWKPDDCELPRFSAATFLSILRGKKMAFIGDSLARNQFESLLCLLSTVETPASEGNPNDPNKTWEFREHNFTLTMLWSTFLVAATQIGRTDGWNVHLDVVDTRWLEQLPSIDYAVISDSHWFFKRNYFYHNGNVIGCTACNNPNIPNLEPGRAIRVAFRTAFRAINGCQSCKRIVIFVRTYTPGHFENGSWNSGGTCNRTRPVEREEVNMALPDWGYSRMQAEETEIARREGMGKGKGKEFDIMDVTEMMAMRPDGHMSRFWELKLKGGSDCLHWCLPGPIDTWNGLLLDRIKRLESIS